MSHGLAVSNVVAPQSTSYQGPFGRICGTLPPWLPKRDDCTPLSEAEVDAWFRDFAKAHMVEHLVDGEVTPPQDLLEEASVAALQAAGDSRSIPAGYTYFGQFVDHDITFDPASVLVRQNDPNSLLNFRTPRLDLDNLYGRGPVDQPYMFEIRGTDEADTARRRKLGAHTFVVDKVTRKLGADQPIETELFDLPRAANNRAIIGDVRNDENAMISQMQVAFLKAHNALVARALDAGSCAPFADAQRTLRWLYQWVVWHDFVKRISQREVFEAALRRDDAIPSAVRWRLGLNHVYAWKHQPFMPVEFAVAAYRFGHSMVRNGYRMNIRRGVGLGKQAPLFATGAQGEGDLRGGRPIRLENVVQWDWFLPMTSSPAPNGFPQMARKISTKLSNALAHLATAENVLAYRNLKRGWAFGLPRGKDVARKFACQSVIEIAPHEPDSLWFYVLKEAKELGNDGETLGPLGSTLVASVLAGLLKGDPQCWMNQEPCWTPDAAPLLRPGDDNIDSKDADDPRDRWQLASIIRIAGVPVSDSDIRAAT